MLTYKDDPLLLDGETANDLIEGGRTDMIFLDKNRNILNLYSTLVKKKDMISNKKGQSLKNVPIYLIMTNPY